MLTTLSAIDNFVFSHSNALLQYNPNFAALLAVLNHRLEPKITLLLAFIISVSNFYLVKNRKALAWQTLYFWVVFELLFQSMQLICNYLPPRPSPTVNNPHAILLSQMFADSNIKDGTLNSFPGGHAFALIFWGLFNKKLSSKFLGWLFLLLAIAMCLPRLIGGGHWLSDVIAGGFLAILGYKLANRGLKYLPAAF